MNTPTFLEKRMFDYPLLEVLAAIEKTGEFEGAAKVLGVSKSYISQRLCLLEDRMGANTVCRDTTQLTQFGSRLCRHYEFTRLLEQQFLHDNAELFNVEAPGPITVTIAVGDESLQSWFSSILRQLHSSNNRFFLDIIQASESEIQDQMIAGRVHAAISTTKDPLPGFDAHYLGQHSYKAVAAPKFIKQYFKDGISPHSLTKAPAMQTSADDDLRERWMIRAVGENQSDDVTIVPSVHSLINNCLRGDIWAVNSSLLVDKHLTSGELKELDPGLTLTSDLYWHINRALTGSMQQVTNSILANAAEELLQMENGYKSGHFSNQIPHNCNSLGAINT